MFLSDATIRALVNDKTLGIYPYDPSLVQPCSYDLTLGDVGMERPMGFDASIWSVQPGQFLLAATQEYITLPAHIAGTVLGKSTWGRLGLTIHQTAGHVDPGWQGELTLELFNCSQEALILRRGDPIAQIAFTYLDQPAETPYRGRYLGSRGVVQPREPINHTDATKD